MNSFRIQKTSFFVLSMLLACALAACSSRFDGSRIGNDSGLIMQYAVFNQTDTQDLTAEAGDILAADIVVEAGSLSVRIQKAGEASIYDADLTASERFELELEESGTYTVTVTGKHTKGSLSFTVRTNPEE